MSTSAERRWRLRDLFTEPPAGALSHTKLWGNVGGLVLSVAFLKQAWFTPLGFEGFVGYAIALAATTTPALAAKLIGLRYGGNGNGAKAEAPKP